jgi:hypothetical protein
MNVRIENWVIKGQFGIQSLHLLAAMWFSLKTLPIWYKDIGESLFCLQLPLEMNRYRGFGEFRMKRALQTLVVMSFVTLFLISPVTAATSQGLEWGVALDDEFTFTFKWVEEGEPTLDEKMNATVDETPEAIDDPLTEWTDISWFDIYFVYANGTAPGVEFLALLGLMALGSLFVVPTGNYSLLSELAMNSLWWTENHTIINDSMVWGIRFSGVDDGNPMALYVHYLKSDGFCARYVLEATNSTSGQKATISFIRDGLGLDIIGLLQDNIMYVGIGVGAIVIIGAVVCMRRR